MKLLFMVLMLTPLVLGSLVSYEARNYLQTVTHLTKLHLKDAWINSRLQTHDLEKNIVKLLEGLQVEYVNLQTIYAQMVEEQNDAHELVLELLSNSSAKEEQVCGCVYSECSESIASCRFRDASNAAIQSLANSSVQSVQAYLNKYGINAQYYSDLEKSMNSSLDEISREKEQSKSDWLHILDITMAQVTSLEIILENGALKVLDDLESSELRDQLKFSQAVAHVEALQDILRNAANSIQGRKKRGVAPVFSLRLKNQKKASCDEILELGWEKFCQDSFAVSCAKEYEKHLDILTESVEALCEEIEYNKDDFNNHYRGFNKHSAEYAEEICAFIHNITWMEMLQFADKLKPNLNVTSLNFDPTNFNFNSDASNILYNMVQVFVEGLEHVSSFGLAPVNVHKYGEVDKEVSLSLQAELASVACTSGSESLRKILSSCENLC